MHAAETVESTADITHRRILAIALPIVLSNATVPLLGAVDTYAVGQLGQAEPIGAVGLGAIILTSVYWVFGFLRMGTTGLVAQARGARDGDEVSALLSRALLIAVAAGLALILFQLPLAAAALALAPASPEVEAMARDYIVTRVWGAPAAIAVYALTGWLIAQERTRAVLVLQLVMNGGNMILSLWFVLGLGLGVPGVAAATVIGEWSGAILGLWLCRDAFARPAWADRSLVFRPERLRQMLAVNTDIMIRSILLMLCFLSVTFQGAGLGDVALAANQILIQFFYIAAYALDGFAFAAEALVGGSLGAHNRRALRRGALMTSLWGFAIVVPFAIVYLLFGGAIIDGMTTAPDVRAAARDYLVWSAMACVVGLPAFMLDGIFIGATRSRDMRNMMILSVAIYVLFLLILVPPFGNHGLWAALTIWFIARGVTLGARYPALEAAADP
ncbi:MAG: MATE family efflux transporter [Rubricella sp.]